MAKVLEVLQSGYYKWLKRQSIVTLKDIEDIKIEKEVKKIFFENKGVFGIRKITKLLNKNYTKVVNHKKVEKIMKNNNLVSRTKKKYILTTNSKHTNNISENLLKRDFTSNKPLTKLVSDTTYVSTKEGILYVAVILDLCGRIPLGLAISDKNDTKLVIDCLKDVTTRIKLEDKCIIHSDRGSTYASNEYQEIIRENNMICSMSRKGDCWDNAAMESFFGKMKTEWLYKKAKIKIEAKRLINEYIWSFYPKKRPHESLKYQTPFEYWNERILACL